MQLPVIITLHHPHVPCLYEDIKDRHAGFVDLLNRFIQLLKNEVRYNLKEQQYALETRGLTKEQLKNKFENQIKAARAEFKTVDKECCKKDCK